TTLFRSQGMERGGFRLAERVAGGKETAVAELDVGVRHPGIGQGERRIEIERLREQLDRLEESRSPLVPPVAPLDVEVERLRIEWPGARQPGLLGRRERATQRSGHRSGCAPADPAARAGERSEEQTS